MFRQSRVLVSGAILALFCLALVCEAAEKKLAAKPHVFARTDKVPVKVNKIGPYANPSETYAFYSLPFCAPADIEKEQRSLGGALSGDRVMNSLYDIRYLVRVEFQSLCRVDYTPKEVEQLRGAILRNYYFQMFVDDLPLWGFLGDVENLDAEPTTEDDSPVALYPHFHFDLGYNGDHIVEVNISADSSKRVVLRKNEPATVEYTFSVEWIQSDIPFEKRMDRYSKYSFFAHEIEIQWFSILNSLFLVFLLVGLIAFILVRILKRDYEQIAQAEEDGIGESGWKLLHADVFRVPAGRFHKSALSSLLGTGVQLTCLAAFMFLLGLFDYFDAHARGSLYAAVLVTYAFTAGIAGYVSARVYATLGGQMWVHNCVLTCCLFPLPAFMVWAFLNTVAIAYDATAALPFATIVILFMLWALVTFPLTVLGAIAGKRSAGPYQPPCRTRAVAREIPPVPWTRGMLVTTCVAGLVPFSAIYVEIYYLFSSMWGHRLYTPYSIMLLTFAILLVVTACVTVAVTYFHLSQEDHRWWWRSVLSGGSSALFIFAYCFFFLPSQSDMQGFLQVSFYFGYMFLISYAFFIILSTVGFVSAAWFVRKIYAAVKFD